MTRLFGTHADVVHDRNFRLLLLASVMAPLGTSLISPILDSLTSVYGVDSSNVGLLMSALTAPGIVVIPLMGTLTDRYGRKPIMVSGLLLFGLAGGALSTTTDFRTVLALRVLQGIGFSGIVPTLITSLGDIYDGAAEATAQGIRIMAVGGSLVVFPMVAGVLVVANWRWPFLLYFGAVPLALFLARWFTEPTDADAETPTDDEVEHSESDPPNGASVAATDSPGGHSLGKTVRSRSIAPLLVARGLPTFVWIGFLTYNSVFVVRLLSGTPSVAGLLVAGGSAAFAVAASQSGRLTARFDGRLVPLVSGHVSMLVGFSVLAAASSLGTAALGVVLGGVGFGLTTTLYRSAVSALAPQQLRGSLVSITETFGRLAATLSPVVIGVLVEVTTPAVGFAPAVRGALFGVTAVCSTVGVGCLFLARTGPDSLDPAT